MPLLLLHRRSRGSASSRAETEGTMSLCRSRIGTGESSSARVRTRIRALGESRTCFWLYRQLDLPIVFLLGTMTSPAPTSSPPENPQSQPEASNAPRTQTSQTPAAGAEKRSSRPSTATGELLIARRLFRRIARLVSIRAGTPGALSFLGRSWRMAGLVVVGRTRIRALGGFLCARGRDHALTE
jgi:hypothetical protein